MHPIIRPPHAITMWEDDGILVLEMPDATGRTEAVHYLRVPLNTFGLNEAVRILRSRNVRSRIGEKGDPTQFQVNAEMKALAKGYDPALVHRPHPKVHASPETRSRARDLIRRFIS